MTDEDINADADNWVLARANCTPEWIFFGITCAMESDIRKFNDLPPQNRLNRSFDSTPIRDTAFKVFRVSHENDFILVQRSHMGITVERAGNASFTITPRWNEETLACDLLVGGKLFSVYQISQKILGEFFFGNTMMAANMRRET